MVAAAVGVCSCYVIIVIVVIAVIGLDEVMHIQSWCNKCCSKKTDRSRLNNAFDSMEPSIMQKLK